MGSWHNILNEIKERGSTHDVVRRDYLRKLHELTGGNVIINYSAGSPARSTGRSAGTQRARVDVAVFHHPLGPQGDLDSVFAIFRYAVKVVQGEVYNAEADLRLR